MIIMFKMTTAKKEHHQCDENGDKASIRAGKGPRRSLIANAIELPVSNPIYCSDD